MSTPALQALQLQALPLQALQLHAQAGARRLLDGAQLELAAGQLLGIVGPNGAGKTSLLRALLGWLPLRG
ncbi:MAG: ATP-binding cassette domain-containing protein, partial [Comamonadaceae bacterium]|nr:ATP-binding cassette domain-containing protein [Comamonadaceae bacterium]